MVCLRSQSTLVASIILASFTACGKKNSDSTNVKVKLGLRYFFSCYIIFFLLISAGCTRKEETLDTNSTGSPNSTSVKNQGGSEFCWAYAMMAHLESQFKKKTGKDIVLSPEALGFCYGVCQEIENISPFTPKS